MVVMCESRWEGSYLKHAVLKATESFWATCIETDFKIWIKFLSSSFSFYWVPRLLISTEYCRYAGVNTWVHEDNLFLRVHQKPPDRTQTHHWIHTLTGSLSHFAAEVSYGWQASSLIILSETKLCHYFILNVGVCEIILFPKIIVSRWIELHFYLFLGQHNGEELLPYSKKRDECG